MARRHQAMSLDAEISVAVGEFELHLDLDVADGEVVAVLGPNGSGKTTLLRTLAGLQPLSSGHITLDGRVLDDPAAKVLVAPESRQCGMIFQDYPLFPHLTAVANVAFGLRSRGTNKSEANSRALKWLGRMEVAHRAQAKPHQLSGGEAQRVALARVLATDPQLLLLDEPMAALDAGARGAVRHQLRRHLAAFTGACVLVTHDPLDAAAIADRLVIIEAGRITQQGTLKEITMRPRSSYIAGLMGLNLLSASASGTTIVLANGATLEAASRANGETLVVIAPQSISLHLDRPDGSPRNMWPTRVSEIHLIGDRARVLLGDPVPVAAEITAISLAELGLTEGSPVWASVKATQVDTFPANGGQ
jgi:molybdate transport system ATP-binding protein